MPCEVCGYDKVGYGRPHSCVDHLKEQVARLTVEAETLRRRASHAENGLRGARMKKMIRETPGGYEGM